MKITIRAELQDTDPALVIYHVLLEEGLSTWRETFGSRHDLRAFIGGVRAAWLMGTDGQVRDFGVVNSLAPGQTATILCTRPEDCHS